MSEHLIATHVHDNRGRTDDHLVPFEGTIDWPAALTAVQKVGYDGHADVRDRRARVDEGHAGASAQARAQMERLLADCIGDDSDALTS